MTDDERLRELVEEWRVDAEVDAALGNHGAADRREQCANDLEELIEGRSA